MRAERSVRAPENVTPLSQRIKVKVITEFKTEYRGQFFGSARKRHMVGYQEQGATVFYPLADNFNLIIG
jgi:hypothetical protein